MTDRKLQNMYDLLQSDSDEDGGGDGGDVSVNVGADVSANVGANVSVDVGANVSANVGTSISAPHVKKDNRFTEALRVEGISTVPPIESEDDWNVVTHKKPRMTIDDHREIVTKFDTLNPLNLTENGEHLAIDTFVLYHHDATNSDWDLESFNKCTKITTLEQTLTLGNLTRLMTDLFFFFRKDIYPRWEHPSVNKGREYTLLAKTIPDVYSLWTDLCYHLAAGTLCDNNNIVVGISCSPKSESGVIKIWSCRDESLENVIRLPLLRMEEAGIFSHLERRYIQNGSTEHNRRGNYSRRGGRGGGNRGFRSGTGYTRNNHHAHPAIGGGALVSVGVQNGRFSGKKRLEAINNHSE